MKVQVRFDLAPGREAHTVLGREEASRRPEFSNGESTEPAQPGGLIINADDWGTNQETTDRIRKCLSCESISSVSAMVFMEDSERAATTAREQGIDAGLHLNFTTPFSAKTCSEKLKGHQRKIASRLLSHRLAQAVFHPTLQKSFEYVVEAQRDEFCRLYGEQPRRMDGHHHMHLCANVLLGGLLPPGIVVRRSFSFQPGEKSLANRLYREGIDRLLARHHRVTDFFFSLEPLDRPGRLQRIFNLARCFAVEVEAHPANPNEYRFLTGGGVFHHLGASRIAPRYVLMSGTC